jgi:hypothetical protein
MSTRSSGVNPSTLTTRMANLRPTDSRFTIEALLARFRVTTTKQGDQHGTH